MLGKKIDFRTTITDLKISCSVKVYIAGVDSEILSHFILRTDKKNPNVVVFQDEMKSHKLGHASPVGEIKDGKLVINHERGVPKPLINCFETALLSRQMEFK